MTLDSQAADLYIDLLIRAVINTIHEDPPQDPWHSSGFESADRHRGLDWPSVAHSMIGRMRMDNLWMACRTVLEEDIPGDFIETGVWRGGACIVMKGILRAHGAEDRIVWVADSFQGLPPPSPELYEADRGDAHHTFSALVVSVEEVRGNFERYGLLDEGVRFLKGWFSETLPNAPIDELAVLRLDGDMYESTYDALKHLYPKVANCGFVIIDDYGAVDGCRQAVEDYRRRQGITAPIVEVGDGIGAFWRVGDAG